MNHLQIRCKPIGVIRSEHTSTEETPIQPVYAKMCHGLVEVFPEYTAGLKDLEGFSHLYLLYYFHACREVNLTVKPFLQDIERGVFSTRAPCRPNFIGLSVVELLSMEGHVLRVEGVDILDGTPLLDIKPYTEKFDLRAVTKSGWQDDVDESTAHRRGKRGYSRA